MKPNTRRIAAVAGALAVTGVTAIGMIAGTAAAAGTGTCTASVNVRSEPAETAPVVAVCERGETTSVGDTRDGFVELPEYGGWAVAEYVSTSSGSTGSSPNIGTTDEEDEDADSETVTGTGTPTAADSSERSASPSTSSSPSATDESGTSGTATATPTSEPVDSFFSDDED